MDKLIGRAQLVIIAPFSLLWSLNDIPGWWRRCRDIWNNGWPFID